MGELLRNSKALITPAEGKPFRASDPEEYITRLHHFATGAGFNPEHLTSGKNPMFTNKNVYFDNTPHYNTDETLADYNFDEGMVTSGHALAAISSIIDSMDEAPTKDWERYDAEIEHRKGARLNRTVNTLTFPGSRPKTYSDAFKWYNSGKGKKSLQTPRDPNSYAGATPIDPREGIPRLISNFHEINRNRRVDRDITRVVNDALKNPSNESIASSTRTDPHRLSPQFLGASATWEDLDNYNDLRDVIDLKTGTWAKIDPDGYFPD